MNEWQNFDHKLNLIYPWYTKQFLNILDTWDVSSWKVFEYGCGNSTLWWKKKARTVLSVDANEDWAKKTKSYFTRNKKDFIEFPLKLINEEKFDCIIIDGEPIEWRDDCTEIALKSIKNNGIIIIDNYEQASVGLKSWDKTNVLLNKYSKKVYQQAGHQDWKTAYWVIKSEI